MKLELKNKKQDGDVFISNVVLFFLQTCVKVQQCKICLNILTWPGQKSDCYLRPVSSLAPSCWASPPWLSSPFSLFFLHSRFLRLHLPPLRSHCLLHHCQSHLPHWHRGNWGSPLFCLTKRQNKRSHLKQKMDELTCWIVFGFGELVVRLLAATKIETRQGLEQLEWGEPRGSRKACILCFHSTNTILYHFSKEDVNRFVFDALCENLFCLLIWHKYLWKCLSHRITQYLSSRYNTSACLLGTVNLTQVPVLTGRVHSFCTKPDDFSCRDMLQSTC